MKRSEYMDRNSTVDDTFALHRAYYAQFVTPEIVAYVARRIGMDAIMASTDKHMNDIPLSRWDALHPELLRSQFAKLKELGEGQSLGTTVCVAKEAARQARQLSTSPNPKG